MKSRSKKSGKPAWLDAAEGCLTTALRRMDELAEGCGDIKQLEIIVKSVGEIVGTGSVLSVPLPSSKHLTPDDDSED